MDLLTMLSGEEWMAVLCAIFACMVVILILTTMGYRSGENTAKKVIDDMTQNMKDVEEYYQKRLLEYSEKIRLSTKSIDEKCIQIAELEVLSRKFQEDNKILRDNNDSLLLTIDVLKSDLKKYSSRDEHGRFVGNKKLRPVSGGNKKIYSV